VPESTTSGSTAARILIVDGEPSRAELHRMALSFVGCNVQVAVGGVDATHRFDTFVPHLVVACVDRGPCESADFVSRLLQLCDPTPVLVIVASESLASARATFTGASTRVIETVIDLDQLVDAVRRSLDPDGDIPQRPTRISAGRLALDLHSTEVWIGERLVHLSPTEFRLLRVLMVNANRVVSKAEILDNVWHYDFGGRTNAVETYISYLRRKLGPLGGPLIATVRGSGYVLRTDEG
jgi:two-component system OmpR family response regulator